MDKGSIIKQHHHGADTVTIENQVYRIIEPLRLRPASVLVGRLGGTVSLFGGNDYERIRK